MTTKSVPVAKLVEDFDFYPRGDVDSTHVASLIEALKAGVVLPPVIACRKTLRLADGFHRRRAHLRHFGPDSNIATILKTYKNDAEFYADAMAYNSQHGRRLTAVDFARCAARGRALGLDDVAVAKALNVTVDKLVHITTVRIATVEKGTPIALKRTIQHKAGEELTKRQVEANSKLSGMNQSFYANQLIELIEANLIDTEDQALFESLKKLHALLESLLIANT